MTIQAPAFRIDRSARVSAARWLWGLALAAAVLVEGERLWLALVQPLWVDETWTGAIAGADSWRGFAREVYLEVNPPLYYLVMRLWTGVFGLSDMALKIPGLIGVIAAGFIPLVAKPKGLNLEERRTWALILFFWWGCGVFLDGRGYGLLLALSTLQLLAFSQLMRAPSIGGAAAWCALAGAAILIHYYAAVVGLAQGLVYLAVWRWRAVRTAPAALALAPTLAWMAYHAPRLAQFGRGDVAWHPPMSAAGLARFAIFPISAYSLAETLAAIGFLAGAALWSMLAARGEPAPTRAPVQPDAEARRALWLTAAAGALALALVLISGASRPSLTARYLIPITPSILLGLVLCTGRLKQAGWVRAGLVALYFGFALDPGALAAKLANPSPYGAETASDFLMNQGARDIVFVCDHPLAKIMDPGSLRRMAGFFFQRAGYRARIHLLLVTPKDDANRLALAAAQGAHPAILWIYDGDEDTAARSHPPNIAGADPRWRCRTVSEGEVGTTACVPAAPGARF